MKTINYYSKEVYGKKLFYIKDEQEAKYFLDLTNKKTITQSEMILLNRLTGIEFNQVLN